MADEDKVKISELPAASSVAGTELIPLVQGGVTKKAALSLLASLFGTSGAVLFNEHQSLSGDEKLQARQNVGITKSGIRLVETVDPEEPPMDAAWKGLFPEAASLYNGYKAYTATGEDFGAGYTGKAAVVGPHPSSEEIELCWLVAEFEDGVAVAYSGWYDGAASAEDPPPENIFDVSVWFANGSDGDLTGIEPVEEVPTELLPTDAFAPLAVIIGNVNDDAALVWYFGKLTLALRHQTNDTWHALRVIDSVESPGTPELSISSALYT